MRFVGFLVCFCTFSLHAQLNLKKIGHLPYAPVTLAGCWHHVDSMGNEYALVGTSKGLSIVDVNDPSQPKQRFMVTNLDNNWREVRTWGGFAYVGSEAVGSGIHIVDLRHLPDTAYAKIWYGDPVYGERIRNSHALQAVDGYLYIFGSGTGGANGAIIADLSDPWNPVVKGTYNTNYAHDGFIRGDTLWTSEIYAGQFGVVDISDRSAPRLLATQKTPGLFNHNGELSEDGRVFFTTDEKSDSPVGAYKVSDLGNISLLDTYFPSRKPSSMTHNVRRIGNYLVNPSYGGQLTIVDATKPDNLVETAWALLGSSLVWDADPYLPSGIVLATAKNEGLFVYQATYQRGAYLEGKVTDVNTGQPLAGATVQVNYDPNLNLSNIEGLYKAGAAQTGEYTVDVTRTDYEPMTIEGVALVIGETAQLDIALKPLGGSNATYSAWEEPIRVWPTLAHDHLTVALPTAHFSPNASFTLTLSDALGRVVRTQPLTQATQLVDGIGQLTAGHYLWRIAQDGKLVGQGRFLAFD